MPRHLPDRLGLILAGLLIAIPGPSIAQRYGPRPYGGWWHGGYGYAGYRAWPAYGGYRGYYGYYGYPRYYWPYRYGVILGPVIPVAYLPPPPPPPPPPPVVLQHCSDGSTIPVGSYCPAPAPVVSTPAPAAPPPPVAIPQPAPERG